MAQSPGNKSIFWVRAKLVGNHRPVDVFPCTHPHEFLFTLQDSLIPTKSQTQMCKIFKDICAHHVSMHINMCLSANQELKHLTKENFDENLS